MFYCTIQFKHVQLILDMVIVHNTSICSVGKQLAHKSLLVVCYTLAWLSGQCIHN